MQVNGAEAASFNAVRLDSFANVNDGPLTFADDQTGCVKWLDKTETLREATFGERAIRIVPRPTRTL